MSFNMPAAGTQTGNDKKNAIIRNRFRDPYLKENPPVKIFNVGQYPLGLPDYILTRAGAGGDWLIPLRKDGERVSSALEIPDPYIHWYSNGLGASEKSETIAGMTLAQDIIGQTDGADLSLGVNAGKSKDTDLRQYGVFIAHGPQPTEAEIQDAERRYRKTLEAWVAEARTLWQANEKKGIGERHYFAARKLGVKEDWNSQTTVEERPDRKPCIWCAEIIMSAARVCKECGREQHEGKREMSDDELEELTAPKPSGKVKK